jgi:hypothetical protein
VSRFMCETMQTGAEMRSLACVLNVRDVRPVRVIESPDLFDVRERSSKQRATR